MANDYVCIPIEDFTEQELTNSYTVDIKRENTVLQSTIEKGYIKVMFIENYIFFEYDFQNMDPNCSQGIFFHDHISHI